MAASVAPFTGAWIEIRNITAVRLKGGVAPFTGAWIEMDGAFKITGGVVTSLPSRERGLKFIIERVTA